MTARLYRCFRCGYHYGPKRMIRYRPIGDASRGDYYVCRDGARCQANIRRREIDREAARGR